MNPRLLAILLASLVLIGSITISITPSQGTLQPRRVEVPMGPSSPGATADADGANASVTLTATKSLRTTNVLWLNNTNTSSPWLVRFQVNSSTGLSNLVRLTVGIDNGTKTEQISILSGVVSTSTGPLVRLPPASANRVYVTLDVALTGVLSDLRFDVIATDDPSEAATVVTKGRVAVV